MNDFTMKRPMRLTVIASLFILAGTWAVLKFFYSLLDHRIIFNFSMLMIPIGLGMLRGKRDSVWWAKALVVLSSLFVLWMLLRYPFAEASYHVHFFGRELHGIARVVMVLVVSGVLLSLSGIAWIILNSKPVRAYVDAHSEPLITTHVEPNDA